MVSALLLHFDDLSRVPRFEKQIPAQNLVRVLALSQVGEFLLVFYLMEARR